jgi:Domain of unknown function (DUF4169)
MGELINLRRARKARGKAAKDQIAEANRLAFGRTKAERRASEAELNLEHARLDAHRLEPLSDAPETPAAPAQDA